MANNSKRIKTDFTCSDEKEYTRYISKGCIANGWKQVNNDCWIDSALFSLFASDTWIVFSEILDAMNASKNVNIKQISKSISNYLRYINDTPIADADFIQCKQYLKNLIVYYYKNYLESLDKTKLPHYISLEAFDSRYQLDADGKIGVGDQEIILELFTLFNMIEPSGFTTKQIFITDFTNECLAVDPKNRFKKEYSLILKNKIQKTLFDASISEDIIFIDIPSIPLDPNICYDSTLSSDITNLGNYTLVSIIVGTDEHIISYVWCSGNIYSYDNQRAISRIEKMKPRFTVVKDVSIARNNERVILIYKRIGLF